MNLEDIITVLERLDVDPNLHHLDRNLINEAKHRLRSQAARIANFKGRLGVDKKPEGLSVVQVYYQTHSSDMKSSTWQTIHARAIQDWHLWRPRFRPDNSVLARSEEIRQQLGVVEVEDNGFYRLPDKEIP